MSRHGYIDSGDIDNWDLIRWRGQVSSAMRGARGQELLRDLIKALEAMPHKRLIAEELQNADGEVCALGAVGLLRGINMSNIDPEDYDQVADAFGIAHQLAQEIMYENDENWSPTDTPEQRYEYMLEWARARLKPDDTGSPTIGLNE